jgi:hypothetical protein
MHERVLNWRRDEDVNRPRAPHAPKSTPLINQPGACHHDRYTMTGSTLIRLKHHRQIKIKTSTKFTPSILNVEREIEGSMWEGEFANPSKGTVLHAQEVLSRWKHFICGNCDEYIKGAQLGKEFQLCGRLHSIRKN